MYIVHFLWPKLVQPENSKSKQVVWKSVFKMALQQLKDLGVRSGGTDADPTGHDLSTLKPLDSKAQVLLFKQGILRRLREDGL